jgi:hypothetical protein
MTDSAIGRIGAQPILRRQSSTSERQREAPVTDNPGSPDALRAALAASEARVAVLMETLQQIRFDAGDCGDEETVAFIDSALVAAILASAQPEEPSNAE